MNRSLPPVLAFIAAAFLFAAAGCKNRTAEKPPEGPAHRPEAHSRTPADAAAEYLGKWTVKDSENDPFNIVVFPDGTAVTTWTKGETGALGELGSWKVEGGKLILTYNSGWKNVLYNEEEDNDYEKFGYAPGTSLEGPPSNHSGAAKVTGEMEPFVGVWQVISALDKSIFFIALESDGTVFKTIDPKSKGAWKVVNGNARMEWDDGWVDVIRKTPEGWVKDGWRPGVDSGGTPTDTSPTHLFGGEK